MDERSEIRGTKKQWFIGKIVALLARVGGLTIRFQVNDPHGQKEKAGQGLPMIWICWHNCLLVAPLTKQRYCGSARSSVLASASRDGALIESFVGSFGGRTVRGSSSRRGVAALIAMKKAIKAGDQIFITPDGPRGPRYHLQSGVIKLAQSSGAPIIPLRFEYTSSWRLKSWDRFHVPKPFSKVTIHVGDAIEVPAKLDDEEFEAYRNKVEDVLREGVDDIPDNESNL